MPKLHYRPENHVVTGDASLESVRLHHDLRRYDDRTGSTSVQRPSLRWWTRSSCSSAARAWFAVDAGSRRERRNR